MYKVTSIEKTCQKCGVAFRVKRYRNATARFCSLVCRKRLASANPKMGDGRFKPGAAPWNKGIPGTSFSFATRFKPGHRGARAADVGAERIVDDGGRRAMVKTAEPRTWRMRAVLAWESVNGPLPRGMIVHHVDRDTMNDDPRNLEAKTRAEHLAEHRAEVQYARTPESYLRGDAHPSHTNPERLARGERAHKSSLTAESVLVIRAQAAAGSRHRDIAPLFGVSRSTVTHIVSRKTWAHLPESLPWGDDYTAPAARKVP